MELSARKSNYLNKGGAVAGGEGGPIPEQEGRGQVHETFNCDYTTFLIAFGNMLTCAAHITEDN